MNARLVRSIIIGPAASAAAPAWPVKGPGGPAGLRRRGRVRGPGGPAGPRPWPGQDEAWSAGVQALAHLGAKLRVHVPPVLDDAGLRVGRHLRSAGVRTDVGDKVITVSVGHHALPQ